MDANGLICLRSDISHKVTVFLIKAAMARRPFDSKPHPFIKIIFGRRGVLLLFQGQHRLCRGYYYGRCEMRYCDGSARTTIQLWQSATGA